MSNGGILICRTCKMTGSLGIHPKDEPNLVRYRKQEWFHSDDKYDDFVKIHANHNLYSLKDALGFYVGYDFENGIILDDDRGFVPMEFFDEKIPDVIKKIGGTIKNWQLHKLSFTNEQLEKVYPGKHAKPLVFTGTVVDDKTGRWMPGFHMRSSLIVSIDRVNHTIETLKTIYKVEDEGNDVFPDIGDKILGVFY